MADQDQEHPSPTVRTISGGIRSSEQQAGEAAQKLEYVNQILTMSCASMNMRMNNTYYLVRKTLVHFQCLDDIEAHQLLCSQCNLHEE